jgi:hypothetical protein
MIVARFFRAADFILQSENDGWRVGNGKWFHSSTKPQTHHNAQLFMSLCLVAKVTPVLLNAKKVSKTLASLAAGGNP